MIKNYKKWSRLKKIINNIKEGAEFNEREIWHCNLGENIGFEQDGSGLNYLRPVLIIKKYNSNMCTILPITKRYKDNPYYINLEDTNHIYGSVILSQIKTIDSKRLHIRKDIVSEIEFNEIKIKAQKIIF